MPISLVYGTRATIEAPDDATPDQIADMHARTRARQMSDALTEYAHQRQGALKASQAGDLLSAHAARAQAIVALWEFPELLALVQR